MEKPDANGYVNITWPSKTIPHGGVFHTKIVEPSQGRQNFLKLLLEESKFTIAQRNNDAFALRQEDMKVKSEPKIQTPIVRPRTSRRRSLSAIRQSDAFNVDDFRPLKRGEDREKLKDKLANTMAYGDADQKLPIVPRVIKQKPNIPSRKEQWNNLVTQIRERAEWLAEMEVLGHAGPHRDLIEDQIAERIRSLDALDVDSQCSTFRSTASGFSVLHTNTGRSTAQTNVSKGSRNKKPKHPAREPKDEDENVAAYEKLPPLQYSPRRRV